MEKKNALQGNNVYGNNNAYASDHSMVAVVSGDCTNSFNTINIPVAVLYEMLAQLKALNAKMEMQLDVIAKMQKQLIEKK